MNSAEQNWAGGPDACPGAAILHRFRAGSLSETSAGLVMDHIAKCRFCGAVLKALGEESPDPLTSTERSLMAELPSSGPAGRLRLAKLMERRARSWSYGLLVAAGITLAVVGGGAWYELRRIQHRSPEALLAQAYSSKRPFAYRPTGVSYGELHLTMARAGPASRPPEIDEALDSLDQSLAQRPNDAGLLDQAGRAQLLARELDAAEQPLRRAHALRPSDPKIGTDLAVLWAYRAEATSDKELALKALALLDEILRQGSTDPAARFDRALVLIQLDRNIEAAADLRLCLKAEKDSGWSREIQNRLRALEDGN
jgi:cytochrome c-type biogenesis protein CcmH/NrfG